MEAIANPLEIIQANVDKSQLELIDGYVKILLNWNRRINITSRHNKKGKIYDFICEGIALSKLLGEYKEIIIGDVGSGGGFPGIILSILGYKVRLIEINSKKASFLHYVIAELNLDGEVYNDDVQRLEFNDLDFITSKAVTTSEDLMKLCRSIVNNKTRFILCSNQIDNDSKNIRLFTNKETFRDYTFLTRDASEST